MAWVRSGECCQCGECCRGDPFEHGEDDPRRSELMRQRSAQPPERPGACPLLTYKSTGEALCLGHGTDPYYLSGCNVWPSVPGHIADCPSCTYSFVWADE